MTIIHHGAADGVTGSCHELILDDHSVLIDCGLFQGEDQGAGGANAGNMDINFDVSRIQALILTHVHLDHVGRLPWLFAAGYKGPIYCTQASAALLPMVLEDAFVIGISREPDDVMGYLKMVRSRLLPLPYDHWISIPTGVNRDTRFRLRNAGHIMGSAYVEIKTTTRDRKSHTYIFSGDLGPRNTPLLEPPMPPVSGCDTLVLESTYGDRENEGRALRRERLEEVLRRALADGGTVMIPAFSIGRTQDLLYELEELIHRNLEQDVASDLPWAELPVILDSPLASRFTEAYRKLQPEWNDAALGRALSGRNPLSFKQLYTVDDHMTHERMLAHLVRTGRPAVVIAAAGMCTGGRIVNYLKAMLGDPRHDVLFVGYQAKGTPGRRIQEQGQGGTVELDGEVHAIKAHVDTIGGYSAHADKQELWEFIGRMHKWPETVRLVHGDPGAKEALAALIRKRYDYKGLPVNIIKASEPA